MFTMPFHGFQGEYSQCKKDGVTYRAVLEYDDLTKVDDFECYTPEQIAAWKNDEWWFGCVYIEAYFHGELLSRNLARMGGIDVGLSEDNSYILEVANELLPEAIEEAHKLLRGKLERLQLWAMGQQELFT